MALARLAPGYRRHPNPNQTRYTALLVQRGTDLLRVDQCWPDVVPHWYCDHREHKKPIEALECAHQERARRGVAATDPLVWDAPISRQEAI